jgi:group I intron endonuclease
MWIYCIENLVNGKRYIGQTIRKCVEHRWNVHRKSLLQGTHHSPTLQRAVNKLGIDKFNFFILDSSAKSIDELNSLEETYIKNLNTLSPTGYNHSYGGLNYQKTESTRRKMSVIALQRNNTPFKGKHHTEHTKKIISQKNKVTHNTKKIKKKLSNAGKQAWINPLYREKTFTANKIAKNTRKYKKTHSEKLRKNIPYPKLIDPNGNIYIITTSLADFEKLHNLNGLGAVVNGKRPHHKGWKTYKEE